MGRPKKYRTEQELEKAVERYFASISYQEPVVVTMATGYTDPSGNAETVRRMLTDGPEGTGCPVTVTKYIEEPSVAALCLYLGISKDTWAEYGNKGPHGGSFGRPTGAGKARSGRDVQPEKQLRLE